MPFLFVVADQRITKESGVLNANEDKIRNAVKVTQ